MFQMIFRTVHKLLDTLWEFEQLHVSLEIVEVHVHTSAYRLTMIHCVLLTLELTGIVLNSLINNGGDVVTSAHISMNHALS